LVLAGRSFPNTAFAEQPTISNDLDSSAMARFQVTPGGRTGKRICGRSAL
jgi:hypothetical protein